ncbi:MAG: hypothetical protein E7404_00395 [Ruminococcaceae bacterium]|nr:hypothetical protein [Oscillospiraceae bacterium]
MARKKKFPEGTKYSGESAFVPIPDSLGGGYKTVKMNTPDNYEDYLSDKLQIIIDEPVEDEKQDSKTIKKLKDEITFNINYDDILNDDFFAPPKVEQSLKKSSPKPKKKLKKSDDGKNIHEGHRSKMWKRYDRYGLDAFEEHEVLEMLLYFLNKQKDTNPIAHELISEFGSLENVFKTDIHHLQEIKGIGEQSARLINFCNQLCTYISSHPSYNLPLNNSTLMGEFCCRYFAQRTNENFIVLILDTKRTLKHVVPISEGTENETAYYPRNVIKAVIKHKANLVAVAHNHTGNSAHPSDNDIYISNQLSKLLNSIGAPLIDHIICSGKSYTSLADRGFIAE